MLAYHTNGEGFAQGRAGNCLELEEEYPGDSETVLSRFRQNW
jgi:hypothetical protein